MQIHENTNRNMHSVVPVLERGLHFLINFFYDEKHSYAVSMAMEKFQVQQQFFYS